jgi:steroid 5-alpha reductase family enzyme
MLLLLIGTGVAVLGFALVWIISVRSHNYGFLDVAWSLSVAVLAPIYALLGAGDALAKTRLHRLSARRGA